MRIVNRLIKGIAWLGLHILLFFQTYLCMIFVTGSFLSICEAFASVIGKDLHSLFFGFSYCNILLLLNIPISFGMQVLLMSGVFKQTK